MEAKEYGFYRWMQPLVRNLLKGPTGFCVGGLKIEDPITSSPSNPAGCRNNENDIFNIAIPLAGDIVRWQFIFDGANPSTPPDVLMPDYEDFDPEYDDIPSLVKWDKQDASSLLQAVQQIIGLYKEHHKRKCFLLGEKFKSELEELYQFEDSLNIELSLKRSERTGNLRVVNVLVQLPVDLSALVEKDTPLDVIIHSPLLLIKFEVDTGKVAPLIFLPSHIEKALGGRIAAPPYNAGGTILDCINKTKEKLEESIKTLSESHSRRCEYIAAFLRLFDGHMIEYDAEKFMKISLLFSYQTFFFLIHVTLSKFFPNEQPIIIFQSAYHMTRRNQLYQSMCSNYPYSPRWNGSEMAKRAKSFIIEKIPQFKENCIRNGVL